MNNTEPFTQVGGFFVYQLTGLRKVKIMLTLTYNFFRTLFVIS